MKKLLKYGVASLSLATLGVVATATDLPVLGTQVVHAEDNVEQPATETVAMDIEAIKQGDYSSVVGTWVRSDDESDTMTITEDGPFVTEDLPYGSERSLKGIGLNELQEDGYGNYRVRLMGEDGLVTDLIGNFNVSVSRGYIYIPKGQTFSFSSNSIEIAQEDLIVIRGHRYKRQGNISGDDTSTPPADTGGDAGTDTQTPPADTSGDTGSQDQTPPADNTGGDAGTDTQTPPADAPKSQTLTVVETRQDENGAVLFTKTHSLVLNPGEEKDLGYNPDREVLVRGGNLYRYGNFEDGATLYFTTRLKPVTTPTSPATPPSAEELAQLADRLEALRQEVVALDPQLAQGYLTWYGERLPEVLKKVKAGDAQAYAAYDFVNIEKDLTDRLATLKANQTPAPTRTVPASADQVATTRNQLLAQVDKSSLTDAQKGELAVKITFAETAEELAKLAAELTSLTAPAQKSAPASVDKSANADQPVATTSAKTLPATGELSREALNALGLALVLFSLGLAKARKTN